MTMSSPQWGERIYLWTPTHHIQFCWSDPNAGFSVSIGGNRKIRDSFRDILHHINMAFFHLRKNLSFMNERIYNQGPDKLRSPDRIGRLQVETVVQLCLQDMEVRTLLDIGTGSGVFAEAFHTAGISVAGVDISQEMIDAAKRYVPTGEFIVAPAEDLPFADGLFDSTFFGVVFHEVSDYAKAMREAHRVTRCCTFILEWQYKEEEFGPPLKHRLKEEFIRDLAISTGYRDVAAAPLGTLVLYKLFKERKKPIRQP